MKLTKSILVDYLRKQQPKNAAWLDKVKIVYRPYLCPFDDLLLQIPQNSSVFDIGCGSGMFLSLIKEFRNPTKLGGCEISQHLVDNTIQLLSGFKNKDLVKFNGTNIPKEISTYDFISMIDVFHHIPKTEQRLFLKNLVELMKPGATLIFKDIQKESFLVYWNKIHDLLLAGEIGNEPNSMKIRNYFVSDLGLKLILNTKKRMLLYPHFTLILKKIDA